MPPSPNASNNTGGFDWSSALDHGAPAAPLLARSETPGDRFTPSPSPAVVRTPTPGDVMLPTTRPAGRNYVVKNGDTYWSIAAAEYGNGSYMSHLLRQPEGPGQQAAPGADPDRARQDRCRGNARAVVARATSRTPTSRPVNSASEYRVQAGDSLYAICKKLYGKTDKMDRLYELNKDAIGPNRAALKLGMILKLPDPPTTSSAGATSGVAGAQ